MAALAHLVISVDQVLKIVPIFATLGALAALWAVWSYFLNRSHIPRLNLTLTATAQDEGGRHYLLASVTAMNPSLRIVRIQINDSVILVSKLIIPDEATKIRESDWDKPALVQAFKWNILRARRQNTTLVIEPGTTIAHQQLIELPERQFPLSLKLIHNPILLLTLLVLEAPRRPRYVTTLRTLWIWLKRDIWRDSRVMLDGKMWRRWQKRLENRARRKRRTWRATSIVMAGKSLLSQEESS
jgi:hypothetical protein